MIAPPLLERPRNDSGPGSAPAASGGLRRALFVESYPHAMYGQQQEMLAMLKRWPRDRFNAMVATPADGPFVDAVRELGIEPIAARYCDVMICLKPSDVSFARKWLMVGSERLKLIPNGIAVDEYRPLDRTARAAVRREVFGVTEGDFAVGMMGRLCCQKDPLCFVEAADNLLAKGVRAKFFLIGDGELRAAVEDEICRRGRAGEIVILGWRRDVARLLGALDLFVLASRWEGLSLAILEALACGVPVVASDVPGNKELIVEGVTGLLSPSRASAGFATQMEKLLTHHGLRREYGKAGRRIIEQSYRLDTHVNRMMGVYHGLSRDKQDLFERQSSESPMEPSLSS